MSFPVIQVQGLGKEYVIGGRESRRETFREMLTSSFAAPFRRLRRLKGEVAPEERIWALKDVSFEVAEGEVVGIIGRNGAGKSTLLKILSRITEPTTGRIEIRGRVASLLEVGTGFHPELTGRENIHLNGTILGMSRAEIDRKFDEIVDFAGVETFLDTPVKRYSSGMQVRLAFAVAAYLEPEILVVDEVLAVGDAEFQRKCLGKMEEVSGEGRTVLFVSHNMAMIEHLCGRAMTLRGGKVVFEGSTFDAIQAYYRLDTAKQVASYRIPEGEAHNRRGRPTIAGARVVCEQEVDPSQFPVGAPLRFEVLCKIPGRDKRCAVGIGIENGRGVRVTTLISEDLEGAKPAGESGEWFLFVCRVDEMLLAPGDYHVKLSLDELLTRRSVHTVESAFHFDVIISNYPGVPQRRVGGVVLARQEWDLLKGASPRDLPSMRHLEI